MQLVDHKKRSSQEELEPVLYAALIDSMCQNFWPMMLGTLCTAIAAVLTAMKTGNTLLWPVAAAIVGIGTLRAFQMRRYERRTQVLSFDQAKYLEPRYAVGAIVYAGVLGAWCFLTIVGSDDAIAHMLCVAVTVAYTGGGAFDPVNLETGFGQEFACAYYVKVVNKQFVPQFGGKQQCGKPVHF